MEVRSKVLAGAGLKGARFAATLVALAALAACGGGGGGDSPSAPSTPATPTGTTPTVPTTPTTPQNPTPPQVAAYTGENLIAFEWLNEQRRLAGLGALTRSTQIDAASTDHSVYSVSNNSSGHLQTPGLPGFTAVTAGDRLAFRGYTAQWSSETIAYLVETPRIGLELLVGAPYHRLGLLEPGAVDFGFGSAADASRQGALTVTAFTARQSGWQSMLPSSGDVSLYPANGQEGVVLAQGPEAPNPVPEVYSLEDASRGWGTTAPDGTLRIPGYTVSVAVPALRRLTVGSFTLTRLDAAGNPVAALPARVIDRNDATFLAPTGVANWAFLVPLRPLEPGVTYEASFVGSSEFVNGTGAASVTRTWRFTTRAATGWAAPRVKQDTAAGKVTVQFTTPSGFVGQFTGPQGVNCGPGVQFTGAGIGMQSISISVQGTPLPGCQVRIGVTDRVTRQTQTFNVTVN